MGANNPLRLAAEAKHGRVLLSRDNALYYAPASGEKVRLMASDVALIEAWAGIVPRGLGEDLLRLRGREVTAPELALFTLGIKQLELHAASGAWQTYDKAIRQRAALALRDGRGGGGLLGCWMVMERANEKGDQPR